MKIFSIIPALGRHLLEPAGSTAYGEDWHRDPLAHPVLEAMSARELADLPFDRCYRLRLDEFDGPSFHH